MKIAIVTLPLHTNYGGILQAYALQTVLERLGCEVEHLQPFVRYPRLHSRWKMPLVYVKRTIRKYLGGEKELPIFVDPRKWIRENTDLFISSHIHIRYLNNSDWNVASMQSYDAIIFGSDQIWRPLYAEPLERYMGDFLGTSSIKRIVYAASFGTDKNEYTFAQIQKSSVLLGKFHAVSVREQSAVIICKERFGVESVHLLDPTLLLDRNDYISLFHEAATPPSKGKMGVYVLDESEQTNTFINRVSQHNGMNVFRIGSKVENWSASIIERKQPPIERWIRAFYDAEFIITDSFHGTVFSILFHKPFICIGNKDRGMSRFYSLLNMFGLEERLVDISHLDSCSFSEINWSDVDEILLQKRSEAMSFVKNKLNIY